MYYKMYIECIMKSIFHYQDYREYLGDFFENRKSSVHGFSWREFSRLAGYSSPVFMKLVIESKTNLSAAGIERVADAVDLVGIEKSYFRALVHFNQEKNPDKKRNFYAELRDLAAPSGAKVLSEDQYDYYNKWYHSVIRERITQVEDQKDYKSLGESLVPSVGTREVKKAIEVLKSNGLIEENQEGRLEQVDSKITTGDEFVSLAVRNLHKQMAELAAQSIEGVEKAKRDISGITLGVSQQGFERMQHELAEFRRKMIRIAEEDTLSDSVYRLNLQLFPLAMDAEKKKSGKRGQGES